VSVCLSVCLHTNTHTHTCTYTHTRVHAQTRARAHACAHKCYLATTVFHISPTLFLEVGPLFGLELISSIRQASHHHHTPCLYLSTGITSVQHHIQPFHLLLEAEPHADFLKGTSEAVSTTKTHSPHSPFLPVIEGKHDCNKTFSVITQIVVK